MSATKPVNLARLLGESHAHTDRFSDGPRVEEYLTNVDADTVGIVDHISPKDHLDTYLDSGKNQRWFIKNGELRDRSKGIETIQENFPHLKILKGAEVDTFPGVDWTASVIEEHEDVLDYAHVSAHYVPRQIGSLYRIKDSDYSGRKEITTQYLDALDETVEMMAGLETDLPVILAHPALAENNPSINFDEETLENRYRQLLDSIDQLENVYPELNLKTEERANCNSIYQLERLLEDDAEFEETVWAETLFDYGTEYTVGSDVHRPEETNVRMRLGEELIPDSSLKYAVPINKVAG